MKTYIEQKYPVSIDVMIIWADGQIHTDSIKGLNEGHAMYCAWDNWEDASDIILLDSWRIEK